MSYTRLTLAEREEISRGFAVGKSQNQIAIEIQRQPSTVSRELSRMRYNPVSYRATFAHNVALRRRNHRQVHNKLLYQEPLRQYVIDHLRLRWSPQQIADGRRSHSETIRSASCAGGSSGGRMGRRELRWMVVALAACTLAAACDGSAGETGKWDGGPAWNCQRG